jgi:hypothetical protein
VSAAIFNNRENLFCYVAGTSDAYPLVHKTRSRPELVNVLEDFHVSINHGIHIMSLTDGLLCGGAHRRAFFGRPE